MSDIPLITWQALEHAPAAGLVICALSDLPDGQATMFDYGPPPKPFRLLVLRSQDEIFGYVNRCAHFGVPLAQKQEHLKFIPHKSISCNVHYARYRWRDGVCDWGGDCEGESLIAVPLKIVDGQIVIA